MKGSISMVKYAFDLSMASGVLLRTEEWTLVSYGGVAIYAYCMNSIDLLDTDITFEPV